jgi:hypothetical protein
MVFLADSGLSVGSLLLERCSEIVVERQLGSAS